LSYEEKRVLPLGLKDGNTARGCEDSMVKKIRKKGEESKQKWGSSIWIEKNISRPLSEKTGKPGRHRKSLPD